MSEPVRQLPLALPHRPQMTSADFLVGAANAEALSLIDAWPAWPTSTAVLSGPAGSGKTHLVEVWRSRSGAPVVRAGELDDAAVDRLIEGGAVVVEDIHTVPIREAALFHLLNLAGERKAFVFSPAELPRRRWASRCRIWRRDSGLHALSNSGRPTMSCSVRC